MKTKAWTFMLTLTILALLAGCGGAPAPAPAPPQATAAPAPTATEAPAPTEVPPTAAPMAAPPTEAPAAPAATDAPKTASGGEPVKITVLVGFGTGTEPEQIELHKQLADEFNKTHPDIQVEFVTVAYEEHDSKFTTMLAGGMAPDLVMPIGVMGVAAYYDEWLDISPYIKRDNYDTSDFYGPTIKLQTYPDKMVGLPIGVYPSVVVYNEDLFDKAGQEYPPHKFGDPAWTYDKLIELAKKLTLDKAGNNAASDKFDAENVAQWGWDGWDWVPFRATPAKFGGSPLGMSADFKSAEMDSPEWIEAMQFIQDSVWKSKVRPNGETSSSMFANIDPIESGQVAMWEVFSWMAYAYSTWTDAFNWNVAAVPTGPKGDLVAQANADVFTIPKSSKHHDQAWEVGKWLMEPENMSRLAKSYGCIPARKSLASGWKDGMLAEYPKVDWQVYLDSIEYMDAQPNHEGWTPNYTKVWDATENALTTIVTEKDENVPEVMKALDTEVQGYLNEYWKTH
jgi:multiple sugar transport system substrate-binding protein